ncbi:MAG: tyrosine-type recombinase/integrase [Bacteroidales bacterium]|nr:tyrosine-type recombinase/integrase [Bacteroidales bacterium]MBR5027899.1 tyrosine-type recombinase/integrase [Bacteroidales bacterium]
MRTKTAKQHTPQKQRGASFAYKELADGRKSISLMYRLDGKQYKQNLGLYLRPENSVADKHANLDVMAEAERRRRELVSQLREAEKGAEIARAKRKDETTIQDVLAERTQAEDERATAKYIRLGGGRKQQSMMRREGIIKSSYGNIFLCLSKHLTAFKDGRNTLLKAVSTSFCESFICYLTGQDMANSSKKMYYSVFCSVLKQLADDGVIPTNPAANVGKKYREMLNRTQNKEIKYLTETELATLAACEFREDVKRPFLFACFAGLRISDIETLRWKHIHSRSDGSIYIEKAMFKTSKQGRADDVLMVYLNEQAIKFLGEKPEDATAETPVFPFKIGRGRYGELLKDWAQKAGINKVITTHTARHTFGTLMLSHGQQIDSVRDMLGHKTVSMSLNYAKITGMGQRERIDKVNAELEKLFI